MKNLVNYLEFDDEDGIYECTKRNIKDMKDMMKSHKKTQKENNELK